MAARIDVTVEDPAWREAVDDLAARARRAARAVLRAAPAETRGQDIELGLTFAGDAAVRALNRDWRGRDRATNVLSFPGETAAESANSGPRLLGDVVLARETVCAEAAHAGLAPADHMAHLIVHGVLHLLGYDHESDAEAEAMERLETRILAGLGIADPYGRRDTDGTGQPRH